MTEMDDVKKVAIVLMNLGGPDRPDAVRPFLYNLFGDPNIITLPNPFRNMLAWLISTTREKTAQENYALQGGRSPIVPNSKAQGEALEAALRGLEEFAGVSFKTFLAMRHWHPMSPQTASEIAHWQPDRIILLPLYPQYSTTTTKSSFDEWRRAASEEGLEVPTTRICCYPTETGFIAANAELAAPYIRQAQQSESGPVRVLFSSHSLPEKVIKAGDPYQWQTQQTCEAIAQCLAQTHGLVDLDWVACYQSKVGPLPWIGPSTEAEIHRAAADGVSLVVVPMSFVSEHIETTVEIGIEYRELAEKLGISYFGVVPTVSDHPAFISGLARLVIAALSGQKKTVSEKGERLCPHNFAKCCQNIR